MAFAAVKDALGRRGSFLELAGQDRNACDESHLNLPDQNVGISRQAYQRMRTLGISSEMVAQTLNAPDRVQRLPLSTIASYFGEFDGRRFA
jgi:hypothetical protein